MPPLPKTSATRQRRNKSTTASTLRAVENPTVPDLPGEEWLDQTLDWWRDVWSSPMAPEYDDSDRHGLYMLAALVDQFWRKPSPTLAGEIRLQRQCFGLTPIDRRRLQWEIARGEDAEDAREARKQKRARQPKAAEDPRRFLAS